MGSARPLKGTLCCCQSAQPRSGWKFTLVGRGKKNAEHFVPAEKEERSWAGETSEPLNGLGGATHLLRLVSEEQNRVWELLGQSSEPILTDTDLWPCSASFAQISAGLIVRAQFLNCPFVRAASCAENQML